MILLAYIARIISKTPSRKLIHHNFWFWWTFSEAIEYIICAFILPQDVQLQLKSSPRLYSFNCIIPGDRLLESLRYNISWTWSQVVESNTNNKWCFLVDTKGSITPKNSKMVGIYDENVIFYILSITIDSDANNILCQNVSICSSSCKLFPYKLYFTIIFCS